MRRLPTVSLLFCLCTSLAAAVTTNALNGVWEGRIQIDAKDYRIVLHLGEQADGSSVAVGECGGITASHQALCHQVLQERSPS